MKHRILIAEDDESIVASLEFLMRGAGFETRVARDGESALAALEEFGPLSQASLGRHTGLDPSAVVAALNDLTTRGFVARFPDPTDARRNIVTLTAAGAEHLEVLDRLLGEVQDELLAPLSVPQRAELVRLLGRVADR